MIGAAGGFRPAVVKGNACGFVVTGTDAAGNYVAYTSTGAGSTWLPTGSLGSTSGYVSPPAATVGPGGTVIAAGSAAAAKTGQQAILLQATSRRVHRRGPVRRAGPAGRRGLDVRRRDELEARPGQRPAWPGGSDQLTALVPTGARVTAIASAATLLSQRPAVLTLPAR